MWVIGGVVLLLCVWGFIFKANVVVVLSMLCVACAYGNLFQDGFFLA